MVPGGVQADTGDAERINSMIKNLCVTFFGLVIGCSTAFAQQVRFDTAETRWTLPTEQIEAEVPKTTQAVDSLLDASWGKRNTNIEIAHRDARLALRLAKVLDYTAGVARSHYLLGVTDQRLGYHEEAMEHFLASLEMEQKRGDQVRESKVLNGIAILYYRQENHKAAIEYFERAIAAMKNVGNSERAAISTANLGLIYFNQGKFQASLEKYNEALTIFRTVGKNKLGEYVTLSNIGNTLVQLGQYERAETYQRKALAYFQEQGLVRNESETLLSLSKLYYQSEESTQRALSYARQSLQKAKDINFKEAIIAAYEHIANIYEGEGDFEQALAVYKQFKATQDSLLNSERIIKIEEMQARFDVEQKNRQIQLLNKESALQQARLDRQKLWRIGMFSGIALLMIIAGLLYRYNKQKKKANKLLEEKNQQIKHKNTELMLLNEEKSEFMGMAVHDLRNPLSGIKSVLSMLQADGPMPAEEKQEYLQIIDQSADRMLILINNLLDINAVEEGGRPLEMQSVKADTVMRDAVESQRRNAAEKDITIITQLQDPDTATMVQANEEALQRVLENLVSNAVKYSPHGALVEVESEQQSDQMVISVRDNGPGIPLDEQNQLFKRFSRISTQPTGNESSTGLGLFVVKKLIEKMNGEVHCESEPGVGTTFIVRLAVVAEEIPQT